MCMCGATDCPSCGRAQGYRVERNGMGQWFNPIGCARCEDELVQEEGDLCETCRDEVCPKCGSYDTVIGLHHEATAAIPECHYNYCEACDHQWGHG